MSEVASVDPAVANRPGQRRRKWLIVLGILLALAGLGIATHSYLNELGRRRLAEAMARADQTDPGWQIDDLEAHRRSVPDEQNSALVLATVVRLKPQSWMAVETQTALDSLDQARQLSPEQITLLRKDLEKIEAPLAAARKLKDTPWGRFPITWAPDGISTLIPHIQDVREVANLLKYDAILRAQEKDLDGALESTRAELNVGRSLGDEPTMIAMLVRIAIEAGAVLQFERTLAQGEPSEAALAAFQKLLENELEQPLFLIAARGERAMSDRALAFVLKSRVQPAQLVGVSLGSFGKTRIGRYQIEDLVATVLFGSTDRQRAALLDFQTDIIEAAKLPVAEGRGRMEVLSQSLARQPALVRMMAPAHLKIYNSYLRHQAFLRAALTAVAAERYRHVHGAWPETIMALVPEYFEKVPLDPFDDKPLRLHKVESGIVIYSVGPNGKDDGGDVANTAFRQSMDIGLKLWDVKQRRQPPAPPRRPNEEGVNP